METKVVCLVTRSAPAEAPEHIVLAAYILRLTQPHLRFELLLDQASEAKLDALRSRLRELDIASAVALAPAADQDALQARIDAADVLVVAAEAACPEWERLAKVDRGRPVIVSRGLLPSGALLHRRMAAVDFWDPRELANTIGRLLPPPEGASAAAPVPAGVMPRRRRPPAKVATWRLGHGDAMLRQRSLGN